jgi:hypothetical protein
LANISGWKETRGKIALNLNSNVETLMNYDFSNMVHSAGNDLQA